jgi:hypothetical protein
MKNEGVMPKALVLRKATNVMANAATDKIAVGMVYFGRYMMVGS